MPVASAMQLPIRTASVSRLNILTTRCPEVSSEVNQSWTYPGAGSGGKGCKRDITSCNYDPPINQRRQRRQPPPGVRRLPAGDRAGGGKFGDAGICILPFPQELLCLLPRFGNFPIVLK